MVRQPICLTLDKYYLYFDVSNFRQPLKILNTPLKVLNYFLNEHQKANDEQNQGKNFLSNVKLIVECYTRQKSTCEIAVSALGSW